MSLDQNFIRTQLSYLSKKKNVLEQLGQYARENSLRILLTGGTLRDALLEKEEFADLDILVEAKEELFAKHNKQLLQICIKDTSSDVDLKRVESAHRYVSKFDYTLNSLLLELKSLSIEDPSGRGLQDLGNRELNSLAHCLLFSNPHGVLRGFRLAAQLDLHFSEELLSLFRKYPTVVTLDNEEGKTRTYGELIYFLSIPTIDTPLEKFVKLGFLAQLFPELSICLNSSTHFGTIQSRLTLLSQAISRLPQRNSNRILELQSVRYRSNVEQRTDTESFRVAPLALLRLSAMCLEIAAAFRNLDSSEQQAQTPFLLVEEIEQNFLKNMCTRFQNDPTLTRFIAEVREIVLRCRVILSTLEQGTEEQIKQSMDGSIGYLSSILARTELARLQSKDEHSLLIDRRLERLDG